MSELNHNEPTKELVAVRLTCPYCEKKEPSITGMVLQFGKQLCQIFICAHCGKPLPVFLVPEVPRIVEPKVVLPGRM